MVGKIACAAGLALTLLISGGSARACEGSDCPAPAESRAKPLDIKKFMREQAASTRVGERHTHHPARTAAKTKPAGTKSAGTKSAGAKSAARKPAAQRTVAARPNAAPLPTAAAASFASQGDPAVPVVSSGEFNAIDGAIPASSPETTGAALAIEPNVQLVAAAELNDIDRKVDEVSPFPAPATIAAAPAQAETAPAPAQVAQVSWLQWLWSVVTGTFAALATAVRQLVHL